MNASFHNEAKRFSSAYSDRPPNGQEADSFGCTCPFPVCKAAAAPLPLGFMPNRSVHAFAAMGGNGDQRMDTEQDVFILSRLPGNIRWLLDHAPTDLEQVWEYGICPVDGCAALTRFLKPWAQIDRAWRIDPVELHARVTAASEELECWNRRVRSGTNRRERRPRHRNDDVAALLASTARQIEDYLLCRQALTPRQWVEQALAAVERLHVLRPRDAEYQHGISLAASGLEQALDQFPD